MHPTAAPLTLHSLEYVLCHPSLALNCISDLCFEIKGEKGPDEAEANFLKNEPDHSKVYASVRVFETYLPIIPWQRLLNTKKTIMLSAYSGTVTTDHFS